MKTLHDRCVCGSGRDYMNCCGAHHAGAPAPDVVTLMRSRYSAYVLRLETYLLATWHPDTRPACPEFAAEPLPAWLGLQMIRHQVLSANLATVEFVARYKLRGRAFRLHEVSQFVRQDGRWYYLDGQFPDADERADQTLAAGPAKTPANKMPRRLAGGV